MKRSSFLKTLVGLAVAPKVLAIDSIAQEPDKAVMKQYDIQRMDNQPLKVGDTIIDSNGETGYVVSMTMDSPKIKNIKRNGPEIDITNGFKHFRSHQIKTDNT